MHRFVPALLLSAAMLWMAPAANAQTSSFNRYVLAAVHELYDKYRGRGYDIHDAFTHDLPYGGGTVKASHPPLTMCVAQVEETIVTAINIYAAQNHDTSVYTKIPVAAWATGTPTSLRANIFMYGGTGSRGTGDTLARFDLGEEVPFPKLIAGDFINLNRETSGHAVVFLGFLNPKLERTDTYSPDVVGFRYFSAQGKGKPDAGVAFRNAYFAPTCPGNSLQPCNDAYCPVDHQIPRDCGIRKQTDKSILNSGRMWSPDKWAYLDAVNKFKASTRSALEQLNRGQTRAVIDLLLDQELSKTLTWSNQQEQFFDDPGTD